MPSMKGLAVGVGAVLIVGYLALRTGAARGLSDIATSVTEAVASPFAGLGTGLSTLAGGLSDVFSPTIAPTIAPKFDWSGWLPFGPGNGNGNGNGVNGAGARTGYRQEDRNLNGNGPILTVHGPDPTYTFKPDRPKIAPG
ncbi:unnamed protein product, partial [marine sediment metagenome]